MRKLLGLLSLVLIAFVVATTPAVAQSGVVTATVRPNPLQVEVEAPAVVNVGTWFDIDVTITNLGAETVTKLNAEIYTPAEITARGKKKRIGNLGAGESQTVSWRAKATSSGSDLIVQISVKGILNNQEIIVEETTMISPSGSLAFFWRRWFFGS